MILHLEFKGRYYAELRTLEEHWSGGVDALIVNKVINPGCGVVARMGDAWTCVRAARCRETGVFRLRAQLRNGTTTERLTQGSEEVFILIRQAGPDDRAEVSVHEFARATIEAFCIARLEA